MGFVESAVSLLLYKGLDIDKYVKAKGSASTYCLLGNVVLIQTDVCLSPARLR